MKLLPMVVGETMTTHGQGDDDSKDSSWLWGSRILPSMVRATNTNDKQFSTR